MSPHHDDKRPSAAPAAAGQPTLEALLRLKRAEKPDPAFWDEFERGLREKQLAAIIEPRPWWLGLALFGRRLVPAGLPVSAAAAAMLAVMVVRTQAPFGGVAGPVEFGPDLPLATHAVASIDAGPELASVAPSSHSQTVDAARPGQAPMSSGANTATDASAGLAGGGDLPSSSPLLASSGPLEATSSSAAAHSAKAAAGSAASAIPTVVPSLLELLPGASIAAAPSASQLAITRNLAALRAEMPEIASFALPPASSGAVAAIVPTATAASNEADEPLQMIVQNPRHARVLVAMAEGAEIESAASLAQVRDRLTHRLGSDETRLGSVSRLGVGGDRFSLSF
jgi:hypothetical protein